MKYAGFDKVPGYSSCGHVAIVVGVKPGRLYLIQQNGRPGRVTVTFDVLHRIGNLGRLNPFGWIHSPRNTGGPNITW